MADNKGDVQYVHECNEHSQYTKSAMAYVQVRFQKDDDIQRGINTCFPGLEVNPVALVAKASLSGQLTMRSQFLKAIEGVVTVAERVQRFLTLDEHNYDVVATSGRLFDPVARECVTDRTGDNDEPATYGTKSFMHRSNMTCAYTAGEDATHHDVLLLSLGLSAQSISGKNNQWRGYKESYKRLVNMHTIATSMFHLPTNVGLAVLLSPWIAKAVMDLILCIDGAQSLRKHVSVHT